MLVGNKCDKERDVPESIAEQFAHNNDFNLFMETSALQAENVEKLFYEIADVLVAKSQSSHNNSMSHTVNSVSSLERGSQEKSSCFSCQYSWNLMMWLLWAYDVVDSPEKIIIRKERSLIGSYYSA